MVGDGGTDGPAEPAVPGVFSAQLSRAGNDRCRRSGGRRMWRAFVSMCMFMQQCAREARTEAAGHIYDALA